MHQHMPQDERPPVEGALDAQHTSHLARQHKLRRLLRSVSHRVAIATRRSSLPAAMVVALTSVHPASVKLLDDGTRRGRQTDLCREDSQASENERARKRAVRRGSHRSPAQTLAARLKLHISFGRSRTLQRPRGLFDPARRAAAPVPAILFHPRRVLTTPKNAHMFRVQPRRHKDSESGARACTSSFLRSALKPRSLAPSGMFVSCRAPSNRGVPLLPCRGYPRIQHAQCRIIA